MSTDRHEDLLDILRRSPGAVPGEVLAAALRVSSRSIRTYAKEINAKAGTDLVRASHHGYQLDQAAYRRYRATRRRSGRKPETPRQRLYFLARHLVTQPEGIHVDRLAEMLAVSRDTIDSDLARARELLKVHDLRVRRERDVLTIDGTERSKRRLVRQVLLDSAEGINPAALRAFEQDYPDLDVRLLRRLTRAALREAGFDVSEFVLNDIVIHLAIAADRVRGGHTVEAVPEGPWPEHAHAAEESSTAGGLLLAKLCDAVMESVGVSLPPGERATLDGIVTSRTGRGSETEVSAEVLTLVRDTMGVVSDHFLLELGDEPVVASLALHVQGLIARARSGRGLRNPLGTSFKTMHPLVHELALLFARTIEAQAGIVVAEGEVDFLSFHLGSLFQRQLDRGPLLTVTVVAPRYLDVHETLAARLGEELAGEAIVEDLVTTLDHDWESIRSDLVISTIDLATVTSVPVVPVGPFLSREDLERVQDAVRGERARVVRQQLRSNVLSLVDPRLFLAVPSVSGRDEALATMCAAMHAAGYVDEGFLEDVQDRERRSSTAFGTNFAIPHSLFLDAASTGIGVLVTERPIPWGDVPVRLVLLLAVSQDQRRVFRDVLDRLIGILGRPTAVNSLIGGSTDYEGFIASLAALLDA